jgi:hypothetical protein
MQIYSSIITVALRGKGTLSAIVSGRDALPRDPRQVRAMSCLVQRLRWSIRSGAPDVACHEHVLCCFWRAHPASADDSLRPFHIELWASKRFRELAFSRVVPSVDVLRRTRRNAYTIVGAAPDVVIGHSAAVRTGTRPGL